MTIELPADKYETEEQKSVNTEIASHEAAMLEIDRLEKTQSEKSQRSLQLFAQIVSKLTPEQRLELGGKIQAKAEELAGKRYSDSLVTWTIAADALNLSLDDYIANVKAATLPANVVALRTAIRGE